MSKGSSRSRGTISVGYKNLNTDAKDVGADTSNLIKKGCMYINWMTR